MAENFCQVADNRPPECGARAVPAGGTIHPALGRLRASVRPALGPAREVHSLNHGRGGRVTSVRPSVRGKHGLELSGGVRSPKREPRRGAGRRAHPHGCAAAARTGRWRHWPVRPGHWLDAPVGAPPPSGFFRGRNRSFVPQYSDAMRRENAAFCSRKEKRQFPVGAKKARTACC